MGRLGKKDSRLSEVKAVLQRLQGIGTEDEFAGAPPRPGPRTLRGAPAVAAATIVVTAAGILGVVALFVGSNRPRDAASNARPASAAGAPAAAPEAGLPAAAAPAPPGISAAKGPAVRTVLEGARGLMAKGQVRAARERLLTLADQGSPDAAWDLARSYDPNVLMALPRADAPANVKEAERWYRAWYAAAVREGLVADSVSLERIIGSMRQ
ncbi:MAG TPA: hypothetical protein VGF29_13845 [Hyphomicrobiaceae bacterium]|jgi:hypothetical protein